jgi:branched-chain amino acid transport system ATP-binding protein
VSAALRVHGLNAFYGHAQALFALDFELGAGEVLALVGRNGAGKSTTLKALMGLARATGSIDLAGNRIDALPSYARARRGLGYVPEDRRIFTDLTVLENLSLGAQGRALDLEPLLRLFPNLREMLGRPAAQMSGGEQQMLAVARTLLAKPSVVLLDEPSEGIAPIVVAKLAAAVRAMKADGVAVLLSEQNPHFVAAVADRALLIDRGHLAGSATIEELMLPTEAVRRVLSL